MIQRMPRSFCATALIFALLTGYTFSVSAQQALPGVEAPSTISEIDQLENKVKSLRAEGKYSEAIPLAMQAIQLREQTQVVELPGLAESLRILGVLYLEQGEYPKAEPPLKRALSILEQVNGSNHPDVARCINNLANLYRAQWRFAEAEPLYKQALTIRQQSLGSDHPDVAKSLSNLASFYRDQGRYSEAEPLLKQALDIFNKALGPNTPEAAYTLGSLAIVYKDQGKYSEAEPLYQQSLALREKSGGLEHPDVAKGLNDLAVLYWEQGRYSEAEPLYRRALAIREKKLGMDHPLVAQTASDLSALLTISYRYAEAEKLLQRAQAIREKSLDADNPDLAASTDNLASLYKAQGRYSEAEPLYRKALDIWEKAFGKVHPDVALPLDSLAEIARYQGKDQEAEQLYLRALTIREQIFGSNHPTLASDLNGLSQLYTRQGRHKDALAALTRSLAIQEDNLERNLTTGTDQQKRAYLATLAEGEDLALSVSGQSHQAAQLALETVLRRKGRVLDTLSANQNLFRQRLAPEERSTFEALTTVRTQLAALTVRGPSDDAVERYREQLTQLQAKTEQLESQMSNLSAEFRVQSVPVTIQAVRHRLPKDNALIEVVRYRPVNFKATGAADQFASDRYTACLLDHSGRILWFDLGEAKIIDSAVNRFREALVSDQPRSTVTQTGQELDRLVMQPIRRNLGGVRTIMLSPDGALNLVPFSALVDEHQHYLIERYALVYLSSGRDLLRSQPTLVSSAPLIVADPDFSSSQQSKEVIASANQSRGNSNLRSLSLQMLHYSRLPGTAREAEIVSRLVPGSRVLIGSLASENALKQVHSPRLLHIATHGFFLNARPFEAENSLLRSGLALAGFNNRMSGSEDGVLTALEASGLDLYGTKMVVLSACETGLGQVAAGEGIYGLRRALTLAGAQTQVISLWKVDDLATVRLMENFYTQLKAKRKIGQSLREAQLNMLKQQKFRHPRYWASFIFSSTGSTDSL